MIHIALPQPLLWFLQSRCSYLKIQPRRSPLNPLMYNILGAIYSHVHLISIFRPVSGLPVRGGSFSGAGLGTEPASTLSWFSFYPLLSDSTEPTDLSRRKRWEAQSWSGFYWIQVLLLVPLMGQIVCFMKCTFVYDSQHEDSHRWWTRFCLCLRDNTELGFFFWPSR